jgi:dTDP-4-dehydrorhamnose 3,5-epimerase
VRILPARLREVCVIELEKLEDERGFFARTFCEEEFATHGLKSRFVQCNLSFNAKRGTLRGMHYQESPYEEAKLVRCTRGAIFDVIIDIRKASPTYRQWMDVELTADNCRMLYVPEGFAHGFQTLQHESEVFYQMSRMYRPEAARGIRWNDPAFAIRWPLSDPVVSARDAGYRDFVA